jgi:hypothetical protein
MKIIAFIFICLFGTAVLTDVPATAGELQATAPVGEEQGLCRTVGELAKKYNAEKKLPDSVVVEGKNCPRGEVAQCLLSLMDKVLEKCKKEGPEAVPREDLARIAAAQQALKNELSGYEGYPVRREEIQQMLEAPELPPFILKMGVNGFLRGEWAKNFNLTDFSFTSGHGEGRFLYRVKPYAYWHPTDYLDIHLEGQGYGFSGGSQYSGKFSLYQGFVEAKLPSEKNLVALKVGRQEISYGSTFILGANSFYDGLAYDAARLRVRPANALSIDLLGGFYASPFNIGQEGNLTGLYATYQFSDDNAVEAYGFRDTGSADHHPGEHLDIWGLRGTMKKGQVSVELEPVYESGRVFSPLTGGNDEISAYGGHLDFTVGADIGGFENNFTAGYAVGSGTRDAANGTGFGGEFRNPNNNTALVGDMLVIGDLSGITVNDHHASGLNIFTLGWGIDLGEHVDFSATGRYYLANAVENGFSRGIGLETDFILNYEINENLSLLFAYDRFFTGGFFRDANGGSAGDIQYGYVMLQFNMAKAWSKAKKALRP